MEDIRDACNQVTRTAGEIGMTEDDRQKSNDLLQRYGDERDKLMEEMLSLLGKSDTSNIRDEWKSRCERGSGLLERLDREVPRSPKGEGLNGIGASSFATGEKKVWEENTKSDIAFVADVITKIYKADQELIKKCNDDLKTVRDGDKIVEALVQQNLGGIKTDLKEFFTYVGKKFGEKMFTSWLKEGDAKEYAKKWYKAITKNFEENLKAAKQKRLLKQQIINNIDLINKTKEQLSEEWVDAMYKKGEEFTRALPDVGRNGDYKATDWVKFGESCMRVLAESRDRSREQSHILFRELLPTLVEENNRAFAALTDDPSKLADWKSEMNDNFKSMDDLMQQGDAMIKSLAEGPFKQAARETFQELYNMVSSGAKLLVSSTKEAEDEMKG